MVEQGICAPEDIDKCIRSNWGPGTPPEDRAGKMAMTGHKPVIVIFMRKQTLQIGVNCQTK